MTVNLLITEFEVTINLWIPQIKVPMDFEAPNLTQAPLQPYCADL